MEEAIQLMAAAAAEMRAEAIRLREEVAEMEAAVEDKTNEVEFEKRRRNQLLTELLLLVAAEQKGYGELHSESTQLEELYCFCFGKWGSSGIWFTKWGSGDFGASSR
ncbi:hypothetical protein SLEP1_g12732 [Rubroshorea leprosula]|uniref:Uncharacterized protein n=1 Tax=Rubroshorea leprosula TaxID=152421 RepID=A0AAV5IJ74_9ROSI|nr:hypothetical protein SLEP1_g12732 [Rubroshorea leprosula]